MRTVPGKAVADHIGTCGHATRLAADAVIDHRTRRVGGCGGVVVVERHGGCASGLTTAKWLRGWLELGGETRNRP